ncbi:hypothetical protein JY97_10050 [Alkalispirochaeta odontotermitis]|nr:hypothetical protein JY97_10050 [Alkalispirochaeta odontotermitis]CAD7839708.1 MAG: hypothetical protein [Olavius algarvensis spirochete endosymbiont]
MRRLCFSLMLISIPLLIFLQILQGYRYTVALEEIDSLEAMQLEKLEKNRKVLAGIAVYDAPTRIYRVARDSLNLEEAEPENVLQIVLPKREQVQ